MNILIKNKLFLSFYSLSILIFVFLQLYSHYLMGGSGDHYWMFGPDNAYRITHVWQVLKSDVYPPASLSNIDVSFHYHYGSPAIVAFFEELSGEPVDFLYFKVVLPVLVMAGVIIFYISSYSSFKKHSISIFVVAISLLATISYLKVFQRFYSSLHNLIFALWNQDADYILNGATTMFSDWYGNAIFDTAYLSLYVISSILFSVILIGSPAKRIILLLLLSPILFLLKTDSILWVFFLLFLEILLFLRNRYNWRIFLLIYISLLSFVFLYAFYEGKIVFPNSELIFSLSNAGGYNFSAIFFIIILGVLMVDSFLNKDSYVTIYLLFSITLIFIIYFIKINMYVDQRLSDSDLSFFLGRVLHYMINMGFIIYVISVLKRIKIESRYIIFYMLVFIISIGLFFKAYHGVIQIWVLYNNPIKRYEATDLVGFKECLNVIPTEGTMLYSNSFEYPSGTLEGKKLGMHLTMFGHQNYASNYFYEKYPIVEENINKQKSILANKSSSVSDVCSLSYRDAKGYIVIDRKYDYPVSLLPFFIFQNEVCGVVSMPQKTCEKIQ